MDLNKVMIIGRLTANPEYKMTQSGINTSKFSVATNHQWKDQQGNKNKKVEYHNIVAWGKLAEICNQFLTKGKQIYIEGRLNTNTWEDKTGKKHSRTEIVATDMISLGSKNDTQQNQPNTSTQQKQEIQLDDIPF